MAKIHFEIVESIINLRIHGDAKCVCRVSFWLTAAGTDRSGKSAPLMPCGICCFRHVRLATCLSDTSAVNPPKVLRINEGQNFCLLDKHMFTKNEEASNVHGFFR